MQCVVTSPPYYGLRDYGVEGQIGLEQSPEEYVSKLVEVFREVRRVLRDDGTVWLNLGDSYSGSCNGAGNERKHAGLGHKVSERYQGQKPGNVEGFKAKINRHTLACRICVTGRRVARLGRTVQAQQQARTFTSRCGHRGIWTTTRRTWTR